MRSGWMVIATVAVLFSSSAAAKEGELDSSFGTAGTVLTSMRPLPSMGARAVAVQSDGKIVAGGYSECGGSGHFALLRLEINGSLDPAFNHGGKICDLKDGMRANDGIADLLIQNDGKILAVGTTSENRDFMLTRYNSDGSPDFSFGYEHYESGNFGGVERANAVVVSNDKIYVAGSKDGDFILARFDMNGSLDTSFNGKGWVTTDFGSSEDVATAIAVDDGKIVLAGYTYDSSGLADFAVARYDENGTLDTTFGLVGKVVTDMGDDDNQAYAVAVDSTHRILIAGYSSEGAGHDDFALVRYRVNGQIDFRVHTDIESGSSDRATGVALSGDKIVVSGYSDSQSARFAVVRYNSDGTLDTGFGDQGKRTTDFGTQTQDIARGLALDSGRILLAGSRGDGAFALVRYTSDGSPDTGFDRDGKKSVVIGGSNDFINDIAVTSNRKIIAAGASNYHAALARYESNGSLDVAFGTDGKIVMHLGSGSREALASVLILPDGSIAAGGWAENNTTYDEDFCIAHFEQNGTLDGAMFVDFSGENDRVADMALQSDGKTIVAGYSLYSTAASKDDFELVRITSGGSIDTTFGNSGNGKVVTDIDQSSDDHLRAIAIDATDRIVVAGRTVLTGGNDKGVLLRYTKEGVVDTGFGTNGHVELSCDSSEFKDVAIERSGNIVAAAYCNESGLTRFIVARYKADGSLDETFGTDGMFVHYTDYVPSKLLLQRDGKIVVSLVKYGDGPDPSNTFGLLRLNGNGTLDTAFADNGWQLQRLFGGGWAENAYGAALDQEGRIVLGGVYTTYDNRSYFALARYQDSNGVCMVPIISYLLGE